MANYFIIDTIQDFKQKNSFVVKIGESPDKNITHDDFLLVNGCDRVKKEISHALKFWRGEDCLNKDAGFDYPEFYRVYNGGDKRLARAMIINTISKIQDVEAIEELNMIEDRENKTLNVTYKVRTKYGYVTKV